MSPSAREPRAIATFSAARSGHRRHPTPTSSPRSAAPSGTRCSCAATATRSSPPASARYFSDRHDFCKHVWAVVLAADAEGFLLGDTPLTDDALPRARLRHDRSHSRGGAHPSGASRRASAGSSSSTPCSSARGADTALCQPICAGRVPLRDQPVGGPGRRRADGAGPLPDAQEERRMGQAAAGGPRAPPTFAHLAEEDDRHILSLLLGAADPQALGLQYVNVATRASFRITEPLLDRVLPLIAQSGRLYLRDETRRVDAARLGRRPTVGVPSRRHGSAGRARRHRRRARPRGRDARRVASSRCCSRRSSSCWATPSRGSIIAARCPGCSSCADPDGPSFRKRRRQR